MLLPSPQNDHFEDQERHWSDADVEREEEEEEEEAETEEEAEAEGAQVNRSAGERTKLKSTLLR